MTSVCHSRRHRLAVMTLLLSFIGGHAATVHAADASGIADPEVRACVERALPKQTVRQRVTLQVVDSTGTTRESIGNLHWKRFPDGLAKVLFIIEESSHYHGVGILMEERSKGEPNVFMYSPELGRDRRISSAALAGPLLGTDFSYEDFALLQHLAVTGDARRVEDSEVDGHPTYVMETTPDEEISSYSKVATYIDKTWCLPVKTQFYAHNGSLYKELSIDREAVRQQGELWVPFHSTMVNHKQASRTELLIDKLELDIALEDGLFRPQRLRQGK